METVRENSESRGYKETMGESIRINPIMQRHMDVFMLIIQWEQTTYEISLLLFAFQDADEKLDNEECLSVIAGSKNVKKSELQVLCIGNTSFTSIGMNSLVCAKHEVYFFASLAFWSDLFN
jgi:hypothetical protein